MSNHGAESHACLPKRDRACGRACRLKFLLTTGRHYGVQARIPEETKGWSLTFSGGLKVILGGFANANLWDGRVVEVDTNGPAYRGAC